MNSHRRLAHILGPLNIHGRAKRSSQLLTSAQPRAGCYNYLGRNPTSRRYFCNLAFQVNLKKREGRKKERKECGSGRELRKPPRVSLLHPPVDIRTGAGVGPGRGTKRVSAMGLLSPGHSTQQCAHISWGLGQAGMRAQEPVGLSGPAYGTHSRARPTRSSGIGKQHVLSSQGLRHVRISDLRHKNL